VRTAPAFEIRGTQFGQSSVALNRAKVRPWTEHDRRHAILDFALAGLNTVEIGDGIRADDPTYRLLQSFGLKTLLHYGPNVGEGPPEWRAAESIGRPGYLCPSVPAARKALLRRCHERFRDSAPVDYVRFYGGDGGGCECDRCKPYGGTFIRLCEDLAGIIYRYHPHTEIFVTNQKFDNEDDKAIFTYLQEKPRTWLRAFCYGPGSDAMSWQPGHRHTHRMDLFRYPGFGPTSRYLHEILHQLPPQQDIVFYNEITHWRYSEFGFAQAYPRPDKDGNHPPHWGHFMYERMPERYLTQADCRPLLGCYGLPLLKSAVTNNADEAARAAESFGAPVDGLEVGREAGVWVLRVRTGPVSRSYRYDQAHRLLAKVLGWGALPSPADTVEPVPGGFKAAGVGLGHRVGLSLAGS